MVDITGILGRQLQIVPDMKLLDMADITLNDLESALSANNIEPGSMTVRDGYYEYNIKFSTLLRTPEDVQNIYIRKNDRIFQIKDFPGSGSKSCTGKRNRLIASQRGKGRYISRYQASG